MDNEEKLTESLVLRSVGYRGYLKFPREFQERFDFDGKSIPNPEAFLSENGSDVRLCFVWKKEELPEAKK